MDPATIPDYEEHRSAEGFAPTLERVVAAIEGAGMTIFARIDHTAGAREAGMTMPPTVVLLYGNPRGGTPMMLASPAAALDLPLRVLVRETEDGGAAVAFHPIAASLIRAGVPESLAAHLEPAQNLVMAALSR